MILWRKSVVYSASGLYVCRLLTCCTIDLNEKTRICFLGVPPRTAGLDVDGTVGKYAN